jgi:hypothetical protein
MSRANRGNPALNPAPAVSPPATPPIAPPLPVVTEPEAPLATPEPPPPAPPPVVTEAQMLPRPTQVGPAPRSIPPTQPAVLDLVAQIVNSQRKVGEAFHLVVLPEDGFPVVESHNTIEELIRATRARLKAECAVFPFLGYKFAVTKGPFRFLKTPFGANIPLFDAPPDDLEEEPHGWVGSEPYAPVMPAPIAAVEHAIATPGGSLPAEVGEIIGTTPADDTSPFDVGGRPGGE